MSEQTITLEFLEKEFDFIVTRDSYNKFINSTTPTNKIQPMVNFLTTTVKETERAELVEIIKNKAGYELQIGGALLEAYIPDLAVTVKKRNK